MDKKKEENPDGLNAEELAVEAEMLEGDIQEEQTEVVAEEEAQGDTPVEDPEKPAEPEVEVTPPEPAKVPLAALDSERHKRKEAEGRLAVLEDRMARLEAPEPQAPDEMPDPVVDPEGFKGWLSRRDAANAQPVQHMTEQMRQSQERSDLQQFAASSEAVFATENTDYPKALEFARDLKAQEFRMWGYPEDQIPQLVNFSESQVTTLAKERGVNPAGIVYGYAKLHGYAAKTPEPAGDKIERLAATQAQTQSTAGAGGSAREEEWTADRLSKLSDEEMAKIDPDTFKRVMGG